MKINMIDHLPIVSINIDYNGMSKMFNHVLLDTGCSSTILDTDLSEEIGLLLDLENAITRKMYGIGGTEICIEQKVKSIFLDKFHFNISRIYDQIDSGILEAEFEQIDVKGWFKTHLHKKVNENHLPSVDISRAILQAEIRPGMFEVIDGNHRIERAFREGVPIINSYKLKGEQLLPFFTDIKGYNAFIDYWNSKLL